MASPRGSSWWDWTSSTFGSTPPPTMRSGRPQRAPALLTMNALVDSLVTVKAQHEPYASSLTDAGFNPKRDYIGIARREGYFALFRQRDQENARTYLRGPKTIFLAGR